MEWYHLEATHTRPKVHTLAASQPITACAALVRKRPAHTKAGKPQRNDEKNRTHKETSLKRCWWKRQRKELKEGQTTHPNEAKGNESGNVGFMVKTQQSMATEWLNRRSWNINPEIGDRGLNYL